jgi:hypothetical protein
LASGNTGQRSCGHVALGVGLASAPSILLFVHIDHVVVAIVAPISMPISSVLALVHVAFLMSAATVDLLHSTLVVIVFFVTRPGDLAFLLHFRALDELVGRLSLPDNNRLWCLLTNNDGRHLHLRRGFISDIDGLWLLLLLLDDLGRSRFAEVFNVPRVLLERVLVLPRRKVSFVVACYADLADSRRRGRAVDD